MDYGTCGGFSRARERLWVGDGSCDAGIGVAGRAVRVVVCILWLVNVFWGERVWAMICKAPLMVLAARWASAVCEWPQWRISERAWSACMVPSEVELPFTVSSLLVQFVPLVLAPVLHVPLLYFVLVDSFNFRGTQN